MAVPSLYPHSLLGSTNLAPRPGYTALYGLYDPTDWSLRYIGASVQPRARFREHLNIARQGRSWMPLRHWMRQLMEAGSQPHCRVLVWMPSAYAEQAERALIVHCLKCGCALFNVNL